MNQIEIEILIKEGYDDFKRGANICPYRSITSDPNKYWNEGWLKAFDEKIKAKKECA